MMKKRHEQLGLSDEEVLEMYRLMVLSRKVDERMWLLNRAGKIPFVISCQGQEAAQVGAAFALDRNIDYVAPYYRDVGVVLAFGMTVEELLLSGFGKEGDPNSGGRQMPGHFGQRKNRIITGSSPVTTQVPHAVGFALASKLKNEKFVTFTSLGDGSTNQGDFHEGLNFAGVHQLPVITFVENNRLAISVPYEKQVASESIAIRAKAYGMPGYEVDGQDPLAVYEVVKKARERAISGKGPTLIEAHTVRLTSHSSDDNHLVYRTKEELEEERKNDPNQLFATYLYEVGILDEKLEKEIDDELTKEVNKATEKAEKAPYPKVETLYDYVYEQ
ncbi:MAG TPA: thiamine pyrophosphate-dependent dehydrogenase E1 component subunit alpha [Pseudogracilibacillus sp.]|nr:thiamine pyrophosphate-dependent dehydrogenase E1 component subunit alpha [Pseudogracilibacillus sp.]